MIRKIPYRYRDHGGFAEEWGVHRNCSEWWYVTGCLTDEAGGMFSFQFTLLRIRAAFLRPYLLMLALTDFASGRHLYSQRITLSSRSVAIDETGVRYGSAAALTKRGTGMRLTVSQRDFSLDLSLSSGKGAVWQCDNGCLRMGVDAPRQTTVYYSCPNMPATGTVAFGGETKHVTGKAWFDKQGGPYALMNRRTHWEWFSLRFDDDEELMLFSFPQDDYRDGTYIRKDGRCERFSSCSVTPTEFAYPDGKTKYSCAWDVAVPGCREGFYRIRPLLKGQMNLGYYELLAGVYNAAGKRVGLCFTELLPGVYNRRYPVTLFRNTKE